MKYDAMIKERAGKGIKVARLLPRRYNYPALQRVRRSVDDAGIFKFCNLPAATSTMSLCRNPHTLLEQLEVVAQSM